MAAIPTTPKHSTATAPANLAITSVSIMISPCSVVIFAFYGFIFVDFFFSLKKERRTKFNIVWGIILLVLIYLIMSINTFDGDWFVVAGREVGMTWYPHELLYNGGHYTGFLAGALICLLMELRLIYFKKSHNK